MAKLCAVCASSEAKYKCPTCRAPYCSAVCCKKHKETPCEPPPQPTGQPPATNGAALAPPTTVKQQQRVEETEDGDEDDEHPSAKLSEAQLEQLRTAAGVKSMLANPAITQSLVQIDSSNDRMKALEKAMMDPTFASFMYQALDHVSAPPAVATQ